MCPPPKCLHTFAVAGRRFAVDGNSGSFVEVDDLAEAVLKLWAAETPPDEIRRQLSPAHGTAAVDAAVREMEQLVAEGRFFGPDPLVGNDTAVGEELRTLCLIVSQDCNLRCKYCYADTGAFQDGRKLMSPETAEQAVEFLMRTASPGGQVGVTFFGGEPLLNFETVRRATERARSVAAARGVGVGFSLTTNGTLLTREMLDYFVEREFNLMFSLDGPQEVHDAQRPYPDGRGSYVGVQQALALLRESPARNTASIRATMTRGRMDVKKIAEELWQSGCGEK